MTENEALTAVINGLDATIYAYGVAGAQLSGDAQDRALGGLRAARSERDLVASRLAAAGGTVPPAAAAYELDPVVTDEATAKALLGNVETRMAGVWADLAAATSGDSRSAAIDAALVSATRGTAWGVDPAAFPGR